MHNWESEIRHSLASRSLDDEVIAELACYAEDLYESDRSRGFSDAQAARHCLTEISDVIQVSGKINTIRGSAMQERVKRFWLPALIALTSASVLLMIMQRLGSQPRIHWQNGVAMAFYLPWLIALPFCGAAAAYISRRNGGRALTSLTAGIFPAIAMLAFFAFIVPVGSVIERIHNPNWVFNPIASVLMVANWTLLPALSLFLGAAPVCWLRKAAE